jgi:hypothetical protein
MKKNNKMMKMIREIHIGFWWGKNVDRDHFEENT